MVVRRRRSGSGRLASLGHDFDRGHREYVEGLTDADRLWLRNKPFSAPPNYELAECLHTFSHIVDVLGLGLRAQILDVGCGPGWMSELFARCGYWVTGIDISEDMVEIARGRVEQIPEDVGAGLDALAEFHPLEVHDIPWRNRFDAAVMFDTMHHFHDELETLRVVLRALAPGGRLYIREGARPSPGSQAEENLIREMREHGTLESPFEPGYLVEVTRKAGFEDVTGLVALDELVAADDARAALRLIRRIWRYRSGRGDMNTVVARKPFPPGMSPETPDFAARVDLIRPWRPTGVPNERAVTVEVTNAGRAYWPAGDERYARGMITVGVYSLVGEDRHDIARTRLPSDLGAGESVEVTVPVPADAIDGVETRIDLVREGLAWFGELGSQPLVVPPEG